MKTNRTTPSKQRGLSLIELMVSLAIGAFLVLGVVTVFLANRDSARLENSLARLQENGRFALDLMREDLHRTQYLGCYRSQINLLYDMINGVDAAPFNGLLGFERGANGAFAAAPDSTDATNGLSAAIRETEANSGARSSSDVLRLRLPRAINIEDPNTPALSNDVLAGSTSVAITDNPDCDITTGSRVMLTSCQTAHMFQVTNAPACNPAAAANPATLSFDAPNLTTTINNGQYVAGEASVLLLEDVSWFVADTGRDRNGFDVFALYREENGTRQEMIEGVEHMQIKIGQRIADTTSTRVVDPSDATLNDTTTLAIGGGNSAFDPVVSNYSGTVFVRIALLMQGFDLVRAGDDNRTYVLIDERVVADGETPLPPQQGVHQSGAVQRDVFSTTVTLRNTPNFNSTGL